MKKIPVVIVENRDEKFYVREYRPAMKKKPVVIVENRDEKFYVR